ncbi:hypothetical protein [Burkholderia gladioli]|uniref:hypothetical protein n=1 Tax=Burkholderia gladioli TaxID=28095 RepID=UPI0012D3C260|nr:hypothetical protein [Burkholderia gladioli]
MVAQRRAGRAGAGRLRQARAGLRFAAASVVVVDMPPAWAGPGWRGIAPVLAGGRANGDENGDDSDTMVSVERSAREFGRASGFG